MLDQNPDGKHRAQLPDNRCIGLDQDWTPHPRASDRAATRTGLSKKKKEREREREISD
jgi:hypothetical protein